MGAGQYPAGAFPGGPFERAGVDPVWVGAPPAPPARIRAVKFDPATRTFVMNADGTMYDIHPIDQQVALLLWVERGSMPSAATVGQRIRARIARVSPGQIPNIVRDEVRSTLSALIAAKAIQLLRVDVKTFAGGRTELAVFYRNLQDTTNNDIRELPLA